LTPDSAVAAEGAQVYTIISTPAGASSDPSNVDSIAQTASSSAYLRLADGHAVIVGIWSSESDAKDAMKSYAPFGVTKLERVGNATLAWDDEPTSADEDAVKNALH
jgi:hypothetical protein